MKKENNSLLNLLAGGFSGFCEATSCHPLDTIKVRMQLSRTVIAANDMNNSFTKKGPVKVAKGIIKNEGFLALYKGIGAVFLGIIPKMAIRFVSFEEYKKILTRFALKNGFSLDKTTNFFGKFIDKL